MKKQQPNWYGLNMLAIYLDLSYGQLSSSKKLLQDLTVYQKPPHALDDNTLDRIIKLHTEQSEHLWIYTEQCKRWRKIQPASQQLTTIDQIESNTKELEEVNRQILLTANQLKKNSIDRILATDDASLGLEFLANMLKLDDGHK